MSKKTVIRADLIGSKCKSEILSAVAKLEGIKSMEIDAEKCTLTVLGTADPVKVVHELKKACFAATIVSVEDDKPKKDPCKEACEKACKEYCEKAGKDKEYCEKACKEYCNKACKDGYWCPPYYPYYGCAPGGCSSYPLPLPGCYCGGGCHGTCQPPPFRYCYEERSPGGECTIQ